MGGGKFFVFGFGGGEGVGSVFLIFGWVKVVLWGRSDFLVVIWGMVVFLVIGERCLGEMGGLGLFVMSFVFWFLVRRFLLFRFLSVLFFIGMLVLRVGEVGFD